MTERKTVKVQDCKEMNKWGAFSILIVVGGHKGIYDCQKHRTGEVQNIHIRPQYSEYKRSGG